jgi:hypothetical protein
VDCLVAWYGALEYENELEWWIAVQTWFWNQITIAFAGSAFSGFAFLIGLIFWIGPSRIPDEEKLSGEIGFFRTLWLLMVGWTAQLIKPEMFLMSQFFAIFTDDDTDLKDFALLFMDQDEAVLYFMITAFALPWMQVESFVFVNVFWFLYAAAVFWAMVEWIASWFIE